MGLALAFAFNIPPLIAAQSIALAALDWRDFSSFHGVIPWNVWRVEGRQRLWWTLAITLWLFGCLFMPAVYAIQSWQRIGELSAADRAALDARIAALEAELLPKPANGPQPPQA